MTQNPCHFSSSIANNIADMLGADVVVLWEFDASNTGTPIDTGITGRLQDERQASSSAFQGYDERSMESFRPSYLSSADFCPISKIRKSCLVQCD